MGTLQELNALRKRAKELGITQPHKMKKDELETRIKQAEEEDAMLTRPMPPFEIIETLEETLTPEEEEDTRRDKMVRENNEWLASLHPAPLSTEEMELLLDGGEEDVEEVIERHTYTEDEELEFGMFDAESYAVPAPAPVHPIDRVRTPYRPVVVKPYIPRRHGR